MTLAEKITYYRKRAGLSQDALAEKINVSRQAISKWETGESTPETKNLLSLASALGVTVDCLLSPGDSPEDVPVSSSNPNGDWIDRLPGFIGTLFRQYGWLIGVYLAIGGGSFAFMGVLMRQMFMDSFPPMFGEFQTSNPGETLANFVLGLGITLVIAGIVLAIILYNKNKKNE